MSCRYSNRTATLEMDNGRILVADLCLTHGVLVVNRSAHEKAERRVMACKRCKGSGRQPGLHNSCGRCGGSGKER